MQKILTLYKSAYGGLSSATWWLSLVMLINRSGTMVVPFMTLYLTQSMGVSITKAGFVMSIFGAGAVCGGIIGGKLTDKFGFYYLQMFALLGGGALFITLGQVSDYTSICICTFFLSLINESFRPANSAAIAHYSKAENRTRSYSLNRLAVNLGWACGGALGGFIASKNYHLLFWIDGLSNMAAGLLLWNVLAPSKNTTTLKKAAIKTGEAVRSAYSDKPFLAFVVLSILFFYCFFQMFSTVPVFYREHLNLSESYIGIVMAVNGLIIALFEMVMVHKLEGRRNIMFYIGSGIILVGISFIMFNVLPGTYTLAMASIIIVTLGEMLAMPFMNSFWISRSTEHNRGQYAGLYTVCWSVAQVLAPTSGAQIAENWGFNTLWWVIGFLCMISALGFRWLYVRLYDTRA